MAAVDFGNVKTDAGLAKLNTHMSNHSYVAGFAPTQQVCPSVCPNSSGFQFYFNSSKVSCICCRMSVCLPKYWALLHLSTHMLFAGIAISLPSLRPRERAGLVRRLLRRKIIRRKMMTSTSLVRIFNLLLS